MVKAADGDRGFYQLGLDMAAAGQYLEAITCFEAVLAARPDDIGALFALANIAEAIGDPTLAEDLLRRVLAQDSDRLEALVNLGNLLRAQGRPADAIALLKPALQRDAARPELWTALGSAVREQGDTATAETFYREALRLLPDDPAALGNLAEVLAEARSVDEALGLYARVLKVDPDNAQARLNRALLHLGRGELAEGWSDYEARLRTRKGAYVSDHGLPRWDGRITPGLRLLVTAEQGLGDQIMFTSLAPQLAEQVSAAGGRLILEAEPRLVSLFARSLPAAGVRPARFEQIGGRTHARYGWLAGAGGADAAIPMGSLPGLMRRDIAAFPAPHAYLTPDAEERGRWSRWLADQTTGPFIGLSWRSGLRGGLRDREYAPLDVWADFIRQLKGVPVMLQYGAEPDEVAALEAMTGRRLLTPSDLDQKQEIDRTAALIAALDAVVSAPTSVAWIAAAVGTPTLKISYGEVWTAFGASLEPLAPACRVIAPAAPGDWTDAFRRALAAL